MTRQNQNPNPNHYPRPALAAQFADDLTGATLLSDAENGVFIAAPRRTGKTDFLKHDLKPALETRGLLVMYVDLWSNKQRSPSDLIADVIAQAFESTLGVVAKAAKGAGLKTIKLLGTLEVDTSKIGKIDGLTLPQALQLLHKTAGKRLVLMIDEAQHALTSPEGENAMSALKSARDQMRTVEGSQLLLVMSGSHQDKLSRLVNTPAAPFWGSQVTPLDKLGAGFAKQIANEIRQHHPHLLSLDDELVWQVFENLGERPQFFKDEVKQALKLCQDAPSFHAALSAVANKRQENDRAMMDEQFKALSKEQRVIMWRLLDQGSDFRASEAASMRFYETQLGKKLTPVQVQRSLEKMRDLDSPMVWKSARGDYSLYDTALADWYAYRKGEAVWERLLGLSLKTD